MQKQSNQKGKGKGQSGQRPFYPTGILGPWGQILCFHFGLQDQS